MTDVSAVDVSTLGVAACVAELKGLQGTRRIHKALRKGAKPSWVSKATVRASRYLALTQRLHDLQSTLPASDLAEAFAAVTRPFLGIERAEANFRAAIFSPGTAGACADSGSGTASLCWSPLFGSRIITDDDMFHLGAVVLAFPALYEAAPGREHHANCPLHPRGISDRNHDQLRCLGCRVPQARRIARRVCKKLNVPFIAAWEAATEDQAPADTKPDAAPAVSSAEDAPPPAAAAAATATAGPLPSLATVE